MTVDRLREEMSADEFNRWMIYRARELQRKQLAEGGGGG